MNIQEGISKVVSNQDLQKQEMSSVMFEILEGKATDAQIGAFLIALSMKGETVEEVIGAVEVMRELSEKVKTDLTHLVDTCGTGGDQQNSLNISTAAAIVLASMGVKVAKHGNKAVSSNCGSADVLEALKININLKANEAEESIKKFNFAFTCFSITKTYRITRFNWYKS